MPPNTPSKGSQLRCSRHAASRHVYPESPKFQSWAPPPEKSCIRPYSNDNDNDNELFIQTKSNEKHHKGNINNTYKKYQHYNVRAKEISLEDIMAASIQPPVIFKNLIRRDEADYIVGMDEIEPRNVVDYRKNSYGDIFLDLLIDSNCAMLNGRLGGINDFTSVSVKGTAVADYVFVSYDVLRFYRDMSVRRAHELFELAALVGVCDPDHNIPDHSLLS